jgi:hypothetical protein
MTPPRELSGRPIRSWDFEQKSSESHGKQEHTIVPPNNFEKNIARNWIALLVSVPLARNCYGYSPRIGQSLIEKIALREQAKDESLSISTGI